MASKCSKNCGSISWFPTCSCVTLCYRLGPLPMCPRPPFPLKQNKINKKNSLTQCHMSISTWFFLKPLFLSNRHRQFILNFSSLQKKNVCLRVFRICSSPTTCLPWKLLKCLQGSLAFSRTPAASPKLSWMTSGYGKDTISSATSCSGKLHSLRTHLKCLWRRWDRQKKPGNACLLDAFLGSWRRCPFIPVFHWEEGEFWVRQSQAAHSTAALSCNHRGGWRAS